MKGSLWEINLVLHDGRGVLVAVLRCKCHVEPVINGVGVT